MDEAARKQRNADRLSECHGAFAGGVRQVLDSLEAQGFRPRIQEGYRSPADQLQAFNTGHSKLKFGFHNVTGAGGAKEALACDVLDDDHPLAPPTRYLLALAIAARKVGDETGILWGLPTAVANGVQAAIASGNVDAVTKVGWDPTHIQPTGITPAQAKAGARPKGGGAAPKPGPTTNGATDYVVRSGDNLSKIAKAHSTTVARLLELNPSLAANPNLIKVGQHLKVG